MLEAKTIRREAQAERRTVSGYVLAIVFRILPLEERIFMVDYRRRRPRPIVFAGAARSGTTISTFILTRLRRAWRARGVSVENRA